MSSRAFWDFKLPEGKTHAEYIVEAGVDVILFDPVGYGNSKEFFNYDRIEYANQIHSALAKVTKQYKSKTIFGFSTSTAPALVAATRGIFDKVIIHSPSIRNDKKYYVKHGEKFETGIEKLKTERLEKISNKLMTPLRLDGWEESMIDIMGKEWTVPAQVVYDINNYWVDRGDNGFDASKVPPILAIKGEFDYESTTGGYDEFMKLFPNAQEVEIPNSTHFSMWEAPSTITRLEMIKYCLTINQK